MGLLLEKAYPRLLGIVAAVLAYFHMPQPAEGMKEVVQSIVSTSAIAIGFLATALSILYSMGKSRIMADLKKGGYTGHIVNYFVESILAWFILALVSGVLLLVDFKAAIPPWGTHLLYVMCGALVWSIASLFRIVRIFQAILKSQ